MNTTTLDLQDSTPGPPAAWGSPPTPVLPRWYIDDLASAPLPSALIDAATRRTATTGIRLQTIGDLARFWEYRLQPIGHDLLGLLIEIVKHRQPPAHHVVLPAGVDPARLLMCPLRTRTARCLRRAILRRVLREDQSTTVSDLLVFPNFGIRALLDLMCIAEAGLDNGWLSAGNTAIAHLPREQPTDDPPAPDASPATAPQRSSQGLDSTADAWNSANRLLTRLFRAAQELRGARTLGDALAGDLVGLTTALGMTDDLHAFSISDLAIGPTLAEEAVLGIVAWQQSESLSPVERLILEQRILARKPATLEAIARTTDLSRERIRQLDKPLRRAFEATVGRPIEVIATCIGEQLDPVLAEADLEARISSTIPSTISPEATGMARHLLRTQLGYSCSDRICLSREATAVVEELKREARPLADDAGLVNEADLQAQLPNDDWQQHWDALVDRSGLHRLSGRLALRDTAKARAKAALLKIGHPATKEDVAGLSGLPPDRAGAQLSLLSSVVRADKVRWGLVEWIDDEYEGIPAEIFQRIDEDGGSTRLDRLLDEIPRRFSVSENSVRAYVETPAFRVEHGWVSVADDSAITVGRFGDVSSGYDRSGDPYWMFPVHERYLQGFSITGVPPELVAALGCRLGGSTTTTVRTPAGVRDVSVIWRTTSPRGPEIGRVSDALTAIAARDGDPVCIVVHSCDEVSFVPLETLRPLRDLTPDNPQGPTQPSAGELGPGVWGGKSMGVRVAGTVRGRFNTSGNAQADNAIH